MAPAELVGLRLLWIMLADDGGVGDAIGPRNKISFPIDAGAETVHAGGAVAIMREVVFAGPDELDRPLDTTRDLQRLMIKRYAEAAAQASTHEGDVDGDVALVDAQDFGGVLLGSSAVLGRGPYLAAAILEPDGDVHGLHRGVGEERKLVDALDAFGGGDGVWVEGCVGGVPVLLSVEACAQLCGEGLGRFVVVLPGLPFDGQRVAALDGGPRVGSDDGNLARVLVGRVGIGGDIEDFEDAGDCLGFSGVEAEKIAAKVGTLGDDGVDHARKTNVETEPGCSLHLVGDVEVTDRAAEESKVFGVLQRDGVGVGKGKPARVFDQGGVGEDAARGCMDDLAVAGAAFGGGNTPPVRGGRDHGLADLCSGLAERFVALPNRSAPTSAVGIVGLNDGDAGEVDLSLFSEDHGQRGKDSLAHLGFVQNKLDLSVGMDADPCVKGVMRGIGSW